MNTYKIPRGMMSPTEYFDYCTGLEFIYAGAPSLTIDPTKEEVSVNGTITGYELLPAAPTVVTPYIVSKLAFLDRFTPEELAGLLAAAPSNLTVQVILKRFDSAQEITVNDPRTIMGVSALVPMGLLTADRAAQILLTN